MDGSSDSGSSENITVSESDIEDSSIGSVSDSELESGSEPESIEEELTGNTISMTTDAMELLEMDKDLVSIATAKNNEYKRLVGRKSHKVRFGSFVLYPWQYVAAQTILSTIGITEMLADTSSGKTLFAMDIARGTMRCLIISSAGSFTTTWPKMLESYGLYEGRAENSGVHLFNPSNKKSSHYKYLTESNISSKTQLIVICRKKNIREVINQVFKRRGVNMKDLEFTVIVDEAHESKNLQLLENIQPLLYAKEGLKITREILMTGSPLNTKRIGFNEMINKGHNTSGYTISHRIKVKSVISVMLPREIWKVEIMESPFYLDDQTEWDTVIENILEKHKHVVIYAEETLVHKDRALAQSSALEGKNVIILGSALGTITKFNNSKSAVLLVSKTKSKSLNIHAEAMIYFNPGYRQTNEGVIQTAKRIVRTDNKYNPVYIYALTGNLWEYLRVYYASIFSYQGWKFGRDADVNPGLVYKGIGLIRALGEDPNKISQIDGCVLLANYSSIMETGGMIDPTEETIAWWREHSFQHEKKTGYKTILTEDIIRDTVFWI